MKQYRRLSVEQRKEICQLHQEQGLVSRVIAGRVGCSFVTVCKYIRLLHTKGSIPMKSPLEPISRRRFNHSRVKSYKKRVQPSHIENQKCEEDQRILRLYQQHGSASKVQKDLEQTTGVLWSIPIILKRMRRACSSLNETEKEDEKIKT